MKNPSLHSRWNSKDFTVLCVVLLLFSDVLGITAATSNGPAATVAEITESQKSRSLSTLDLIFVEQCVSQPSPSVKTLGIQSIAAVLVSCCLCWLAFTHILGCFPNAGFSVPIAPSHRIAFGQWAVLGANSRG